LEYNTHMSQSIGQKLKEIRESKGLSLEEISNKTHIRLNYLEAMESNEAEKLLSPVQIRGFLRLYANELGADLEDLQVKDSPEDGASSQKSEVVEGNDQAQGDNQTETDRLDVEDETIEEPERKPTVEEIPLEKPILEDRFKETKRATETEHAAAIFKAIGAKLQARRKLLSLSYSDIADNLHIRKEFLVALEAGEFELLPSPVQARGMLANYAEFLNLDVDDILLEYADGLQVKRLEKKEKEDKKAVKTAKEISSTRLRLKNFFSLDLLMITAMFLGFAIFVIWGVNRIIGVDETNQDATDIPEVADVLLATGSPTPQVTLTPDGTQSNGPEAETTPEEPTPIFTPLPNNNLINIVVIPRQNTWVEVTTDGEVSFVGRLISGNVYDYSADQSLEILTGNAGALQIFFNEQDIGSLGLIGQVVDLIFTESGLVLPTPTNTPTITQTPRPSATPTASPTATNTRMPTSTATEDND